MSSGEFRFVYVAKDYQETIAFYRDGLELPIVGGWDRGPDDKGTLFGAASGIIEVIRNPDREAVEPPVGAWLLVEVDDVDESYQRAREKGLPIPQELINTAWGSRLFSISDPNGIKVDFFSRTR